MKKLFSGKIGRIPMAVLVISLLAVIAAGGVVAAATGYVLWEGVSEITVGEAITIYYGETPGTCDTELALGVVMDDLALSPGECEDLWFKISSCTPHNLLLKVILVVEGLTYDEWVQQYGEGVTIGFYDEFGDPSTILSEDGGLPIDSEDGNVYIRRSVCVEGSAPPGVYEVLTSFTRESPPPAP